MNWTHTISILLFTAMVFAQSGTGRLAGTVLDPAGAAVANAVITVTAKAFAVGQKTTSAADGTYQFIELLIGNYVVVAEKTGFNRLVTAGQTVLIGQTLRMNLRMTVGAVTETVNVTSAAPDLETVSSVIGASVTSRELVNLPVNGRNLMDLALLQPGVTEANSDSSAAAGRFSIAGGRTDSVAYLLDGGVNNHILNNDVVYSPNPDAVAEFRILTSNYTAEYGRNAGGIVSVVTKTGSNDLHGSVFEFLRNDALNASTFFSNANDQPKPILKRNQFGATIGGPVSLPEVFSGRDRLFFFVSYQGQRLVQTVLSPAVATFTPAELQGDFSASSHGAPDSNVASFLRANPFFQPDPSLAARSVIDPARINPIAQNFIQAGLIPSSPSGRLFPQGGGSNDADELTEKLDFVITPRNRIAVTLGSSRNPRLEPFSVQNNPGATVVGYGDTNNDRRYFANLAYTKVFSPALLNETRFTAQRINHSQAFPAGKKPGPAELGIQVTPDVTTGPPNLYFNSGFAIGYSPNGPTTEIDNAFDYSDTMSLTRGKRNLRFGATFSAWQNATDYPYYTNGSFTFSGLSGGVGSQNDFADFLLGAPDQYVQFGEGLSDIRSKSFSSFTQDEWRVARNLVLTLGLRYEYSSPKRDTQGRSFSLVPGMQSTRFPNAPPGLLFPGDAGSPTGVNFPDRDDWAPRFGFAWNPNGSKTALRGGVGLFYDALKGEDNLQFCGQAPFFGFAFLGFNPLANVAADVPYLRDPFGSAGVQNSFPSKPPAKDINFGDAGFLPFGGTGVYFVDTHLRTPYILHYNLSWQQQLTNSLTSEVNYVGSSAHKLTALVDENPMLTGSTLRKLNGELGLAENMDFSTISTFENVVKAHYNSLQASLRKRFSTTGLIGDTYFTLAYTYAHAIDNSSGFRQQHSNQVPYYDHDLFRASSDTDLRQRLAFSGAWDLPFGRVWSRAPKPLSRGWSLYPILTWRTGFPLDILPYYTAGSTNNAPGPSGAGDRGITRANLVGRSITVFDPHTTRTIGDTAGNFYFSPENFSQPLDGQGNYGTLGRNTFRGPGRVNLDVALAKATSLFGERAKAEFRAEFFNVLNHTEFDNPNVNNFGSPIFGQTTTTTSAGGDPNSRIIQFALRLSF